MTTNTPTDPVESFYDANATREWQRSQRHRTEFAVTLCAFEEHLPPPPAAIADIGGGPGTYALALTQRGYAVTLIDLSENNLVLARQNAAENKLVLAGTLHANALHLDELLPAESFDAVLLMGPLYHLHSMDDRRQSVLQALRLLKPGGLLLAAFITRYAAFRDAASDYPEDAAGEVDVYERLWEEGLNFDIPGGFTDAYFALPQEVEPLMAGCGVQSLALLAVEGVAAGHEDKLNQLDGEVWQQWVRWNYRFAHDPNLLGAADHLLYIGRNPGL